MSFAHSVINADEFVTTTINDIVVTQLVERPQSWVAYFQTRLFVQTQNANHKIIGAGPLVIHKVLGKYAMTASFPEIEDRIQEAESWIESDGKVGSRSIVAYGKLD